MVRAYSGRQLIIFHSLINLTFEINKLHEMDIKNNILETIGNTPLIKLNKITKHLPATVAAKVDYFNPGNSIKDRMAVKMIEVAEKEGWHTPEIGEVAELVKELSA